MKRLLTLSLLLMFSFNSIAEPSSSTNALFWNKSVPFMTFALTMCEIRGEMEKYTKDISEQVITFFGCEYNFDRDKLIISFTKDKTGSEDNLNPNDLCKNSIQWELSIPWSAKQLKRDLPFSLWSDYLKAFYEEGIAERNREQKVTEWLSDNLEVQTFIGNRTINEQDEGITCIYRMHRNGYVTYRNDSYFSFIRNIGES